tara:strand:+ start:605 stop:994 length:390 start_codon:yes stop_codon:yes gene_type:complete
MATYSYKSGLGNAASFQVSGKPFVSGGINAKASGGPFEVSFPTVTRWITISNADDADGFCKLGFSSLGVQGTNYLSIPAVTKNASHQIYEVKCTSIFITGSNNVSVMAGLTGIPVDTIANNYSGSDGIG